MSKSNTFVSRSHTLRNMFTDFLIGLTYVAQVIGYAAIVVGTVLLAVAGGRS